MKKKSLKENQKKIIKMKQKVNMELTLDIKELVNMKIEQKCILECFIF